MSATEPNRQAEPNYKEEYKKLREENIKLSTENHFLKNAVVNMSIKLFGGTKDES